MSFPTLSSLSKMATLKDPAGLSKRLLDKDWAIRLH